MPSIHRRPLPKESVVAELWAPAWTEWLPFPRKMAGHSQVIFPAFDLDLNFVGLAADHDLNLQG